MNDTTLVELSHKGPRTNLLGSAARRLVLARLGSLTEGSLRLYDAGEVFTFGTQANGIQATLKVLDSTFYPEVALGGSVGAGESYMLGHWTSDDLSALMQLLLRNRAALDAMESGFARFGAPLRRAVHWLHRDTRSGSRRNICAHYDLGNDFFRLFLDETMMYSCAFFEHPRMTLAEASVAKLDRICRKLALGPNDHVLEIGSGWGGFAMHAASRYGCRVTTTTISPSQHALACERIHAAGLEDRITVLREDYRDLDGVYDKLVSIEMIEAIGHRQFGEFFDRCAKRLARDGQMLLQSITITDQRYRQARDEVDFIKRYIFPGCCIPCVGALTQAITESSDLRIAHLEDIGPHYATTLARWRDNFRANLEQVRAMGYPESFVRMWEFYFCYCEAGFAECALGDVQMVLTHTGSGKMRCTH
jgi:cyclopropane-fatty-acyl-phospholipid synthase